MPLPNERRTALREEPPHAASEATPEGAQGAVHRSVHFELQDLPGRPGQADENRYRGGSRWYGIDLDNPVSFVKGLDRLAQTAVRDDDGVELGESMKGHASGRRFAPVHGRRRPGERLASALIFAAFVAVAAVVGIICVTSLDAAYRDEKNTENLLHDARTFVPANPGGTLPVDSFEDVQQPASQMGNELSRIYKESAHHSWAGHDFDVAFVTGDGDNEGTKDKSRAGHMPQVGIQGTDSLSKKPKPLVHHGHGERVWGWLHKGAAAKKGTAASSDLSENLGKQADYIIGYPNLGESSRARTQKLAPIPDLKLRGEQSLGVLQPLGGDKHTVNVQHAQQAVKVVGTFIKRSPGDVPTFAVPGKGAVHFPITGSRFSHSPNAQGDQKPLDTSRATAPSHLPVVVAVPQPVNLPEPVRAPVSVVRPSSAQSAATPYEPFKWVHGAKKEIAPVGSQDKTRAEVFVDHAARASKAHEAAEAARQIIANGEKGKACFQEGHGAEPCPTIDYHPKEDEHWHGAPDRPADGQRARSPGSVPKPTQSGVVSSSDSSAPPAEPESEEPSGIDWPAPGTDVDKIDGVKGPLDIEHESYGPDSAKNDDKHAVESAGVEHEPFTGELPAPPSAPSAGATEIPADEHATKEPPQAQHKSPSERGRDDLSWPPPSSSNATSSRPENAGVLSETVGRLEDVVGVLSTMMERMMGTKPSQNVYVTNNYNNVTVQAANVTTPAYAGIVPPPAAKAALPRVLPYPDMWPAGGVYADQVIVHLAEDVNASSLYYSINASGSQGEPAEYTMPFVLGPGWTKVEAVAVKGGYNASGIKEAVFHVMDCNGDKCCNWRVVYFRFEAVLARLLAREKEIPLEQVARQKAKDAAEVEWLSAESKYQDAKIKKKSAVSAAEYARGFLRKWGYAFKESQADLDAMEKKVEKKLRELLDERSLIMDILSKLESDELSASTAMGMVQQSLAQCSACKSWRELAESPGGDGAASTFALASTLGGHQEVQDVKSILNEILDDLNARRALFEKMLSGARLQVLGNEKKLNKWTNEASVMSAEVFEDSKKLDDFGRKGQELAGKVEVAKQALERGKQFMQDDLDIVQRHISAIRRILKRIRVALGSCPGGAPESSAGAETS